METMFRLKRMILKASTIVGASLGFEMAFHNVDQQSYPLNMEMNNSNQLYPPLPPPIGFSRSSHCLLSPGGQVAPQRPMNGGYELNGSRGVPLQTFISQLDRRRRHKRCLSLQRNLCLVVANVALTCGLVIGLLFLLKHLNSPLLRSEGHSNTNNAMIETIFVEGSGAQQGCRPCTGNHGQNDDQTSSTRANCCTFSREALQKFIEQMTKEAISKHLPADAKQRNINGGGGHVTTTAAGQDACGALFFLYPDENKDSPIESEGYSVLRGWNAIDGNVAYMLPCLKYNNTTGEFTISQTGYYAVYSHLAFTWKQPTGDSRSTVLGQKIRVKLANGVQTKEAIATDTRAIQPNNPGMPSTPSYNSQTMSIVHLRNGSRLTVQARPSDLVVRGNDISSFGLYRL